MDKFSPIHQHLLIKATIVNPMIDSSIAKMFLSSLVIKIGMVPVTEPQAVYVTDPGNEGFTGSINLATSHIAFHCWDDNGLLMMDVCSCKCFDTQIVIDHIEEYMGILEIKYTTFDRLNPTLYTGTDYGNR